MKCFRLVVDICEMERGRLCDSEPMAQTHLQIQFWPMRLAISLIGNDTSNAEEGGILCANMVPSVLILLFMVWENLLNG